MDAKTSTPEIEYLLGLSCRLNQAKRGEKGALIAEGARILGGISRNELYSRLREAGLSRGRKTRSDAGSTSATREDLLVVAGLMRGATRANGKRILKLEDAMSIARANGKLSTTLASNTLARVLWREGMHPEQLAAPRPHTVMASRHPNHVWQIDASMCVLYYLESGGMAAMDEKKFYKNKPGNVTRIDKQRLVRYAVTDHFSGAFYLQYLVGSESSENLINFFLDAIQKRGGDPLHGVPRLLMMDAGSANTSKLFLNLLKNLEVKHMVHFPENPRVKGAVEVTHNIVENKIESRMAFVRLRNLAEINAFAEQCRISFCATAVHSRHGRPRFEAWMRIAPEQLRLPPGPELCRELVTTQPTEVQVRGDLTVSCCIKGYRSQDYDVSQVRAAYPGGKVMVCVNPYRAPALNVWDGDRVLVVVPIKKDEGGFPDGAPVFDESYRARPDTFVDRNRKDIDAAVFGETPSESGEQKESVKKGSGGRKSLPFGGTIDPLADVRLAIPPIYLPRKGTEMPVAVGTPVKPTVSTRPPLVAEPPPRQVYEGWLVLDARIQAGGEATEEERRWHGRYQKSRQFAAMRAMSGGGLEEREETPEEAYRRWMRLDARIQAGGEATEAERRWHDSYRRSRQCAAMRKKNAA